VRSITGAQRAERTLHHNVVTTNPLQPLLGATLILVAHPDDEVIACGALMQQMEKAIVLFATDGAPRDEHFWKQHGSRHAYAHLRRREAALALKTAGAVPMFLADHVDGGIADQELFRNLPPAIAAVERIMDRLKPACILTLAYEGGHPDHDAACFIASIVGPRAGIPVWESPLYHRNADGISVIQAFPRTTGAEKEFHVEGASLKKKLQMFQHYSSQGLLIDSFQPRRETFRPLAGYDFSRPPLPWKLNYEMWQWKMTGQEVSAAFSACVGTEKGVGR
jgi:N-acetylglucosamine malate deacetylase 2